MPENNTTTEEGAKAIEPINPATEQSASAPAEEDVLSSPPVDDSINKIDSNGLTPEPDTSASSAQDTSAGSAQDTSAGSVQDTSTSLAEHEQTVAQMAEPLMEEKIETEIITTTPIAEQQAESASPINEPSAVLSEQPAEPISQTNEPAPPTQPQPPQAKIELEKSISPEIAVNTETISPPIPNDIEQTPPDYCSEQGFLTKLKNFRLAGLKRKKAKQEENLNKILTSFTPQDKITNNKVETLLGVSDRTAGRYLEILFKQGKIMRFGKTKSIFYQKYS